MAHKLPPPPFVRSAKDLVTWATDIGRWLYELYKTLSVSGALSWDRLDTTGSDLADLTTRNHGDLQNIQTLDPTSATTNLNKHLSNAQAKVWQDHVGASQNVHGIGSGNSVVGTGTTQTLTNKDIRQTVTITATNLILDATHETVQVTASATITLPTATGVTGRVYRIDNNHTGSTTVNPNGSETIEGESSQTLTGSACMVLYSDGSNWRVQ